MGMGKRVMDSPPEDLQILILAGGKGTRSANPKLPKILQSISDSTCILDLHLENISQAKFSNACFLISHGASEVKEAVNARKSRYPDLSITFIEDGMATGTTEVVLQAVRNNQQFSRFLLLLGDTAISAPLRLYADSWANSASDVAVLAHPNLHTHDSDRVSYDRDRRIVAFTSKSKPVEDSTDTFEIPVTGAIFFTADTALSIDIRSSDITKSLISSGLAKNSCSVFVTSHYFKDSGTPKRLEGIQRDFEAGVLRNRGLPRRPGIFLDRDGTLIPDAGTGRSSFSPSEMSEGIEPILAQANKQGVPVFLVTNQPGIAKGQISISDVNRVHSQIASHLEHRGAFFDEIVYCPHHPEIGFAGEVAEYKVECECRKPKPGMLRSLSDRHGIDLSRSFLIGDSEADRKAAEAVGVTFIACSVNGIDSMPTAEALSAALEGVLS